MSACENIYMGIPIPSSNIEWAGGSLKSIDLALLGCRPKLQNVIIAMDDEINTLKTSLDISKVSGTPFVESTTGMTWYAYMNVIGAWAVGIENSIANIDLSTLNIGQIPIALNMSCLMAPGCDTTSFTLLNILETLVSKLCRHDADILAIKQTIASDLNTANIYIPQT